MALELEVTMDLGLSQVGGRRGGRELDAEAASSSPSLACGRTDSGGHSGNCEVGEHGRRRC